MRLLGAKNGTRTRDPDLGKVVLYQLSYFRKYCELLLGIASDFNLSTNISLFSFGAKNGTRTRDPDLGKVVLYQLSYFRNHFFKLTLLFRRGLFRFCVAKLGVIFGLTKYFWNFF